MSVPWLSTWGAHYVHGGRLLTAMMDTGPRRSDRPDSRTLAWAPSDTGADGRTRALSAVCCQLMSAGSGWSIVREVSMGGRLALMGWTPRSSWVDVRMDSVHNLRACPAEHSPK